MSLKTYGFNNIGGARRTGKSLIYIWKNNTDPNQKIFEKNTERKLSLKSKNIQPQGQTAQNELIFYQEFKDEIIDFMVIDKKLIFWGVAIYGIIDIFEVKALSQFSTDITLTKFRAKLCFEKTFTNVLTKTVLPFNERYILLIPFRKEADIYLYNIVGDYYSVLRFGDANNKVLARKIKNQFIKTILTV